ncbi:MAG: hypothetical protein R3C32_12910 [Chloroflexota bacterium]
MLEAAVEVPRELGVPQELRVVSLRIGRLTICSDTPRPPQGVASG